MPSKILIALNLFLVVLSVACGPDLNSQFIEAVENDDADKLRELLRSGADVNLQNEQGLSALVAMAMFNRVDVVDALLDAGAEVDSRDRLGRTALYWAAGGGHNDTVRLLVRRGADVTLMTRDQQTPLMQASRGSADPGS